MLYVSVDYDDKDCIYKPDTIFYKLKQEFWFEDPLAKKWMLDIDKMSTVQGFILKDRWGRIVPPEYLSSGSKNIFLMKYQDNLPVYATHCGDNCAPYVEAIAREKDLHIVLHHRMTFSDDIELYLNDLNRIVKGKHDWTVAFYEAADILFEKDKED